MVARIGFWPALRVLNRARRSQSWGELKSLLRGRLFHGTAKRAKDPNPRPPILFQMASAYWVSQAIYVAAKLDIADLLADGARSSVALAAATRSDERSLFRLLRTLSSVGIFSQVGDNYFALSRLAEPLQNDVSGSLRQMVITLGEVHYQTCGNLLHTIRTGSPAFTQVFGTTLFDYLQHNADAADAFNQGMTNLSSLLAHAVLLAYDFSGVGSMIDVGGGEGELLRRILDVHPEMTGTVLDSSKTAAVECNTRDRARYRSVVGNFFESVPEGADVYLLSGVIHDWDDDRAVKILSNCRRAMTKNSKILIVDMIVPDSNAASFSKLLDLNMMVMTGGRERTKAEFQELLETADYRITRIVPTMAPQSIIEATSK